MLLKVKVNYPEDMSVLENKLAEALAEIFVKKLSKTQIDKLIETLDDDSNNIIL